VNNNLNLASKPFNNRLLPWLLTCVVLLVSLIALVFVVRGTAAARKASALEEAQINTLKQKEQVLVQAAEQVKNELTPDQQKALPAAHKLVERKKFSWSRLLSDLETSLPDNVRVSRIAVRNVASEGDQTIAELELAVFTKSPTTITEMIAAMNRAGVFQAHINSQNLQKGRGEAGTEYELGVTYHPRSSFAIERVAEVAEPAKTSEVPK